MDPPIAATSLRSLCFHSSSVRLLKPEVISPSFWLQRLNATDGVPLYDMCLCLWLKTGARPYYSTKKFAQISKSSIPFFVSPVFGDFCGHF